MSVLSRRRLGVRTAIETFGGALSLLLASTPHEAQEMPTLVSVQGLAYDSLHMRPLVGALIGVTGLRRSAISDASGRFALDSIPVGKNEFVLQHEALDSLLISGIRTAVDVTARPDLIRLGVPSLVFIWHRACQGNAPSDSGLMFGVVRDARSNAPMSGAAVSVSWADVRFDRRSGATAARVGGTVVSGADGAFAVCGVPNGVLVEVRARRSGSSTDAIDLWHLAPGLTRRDLLLAAEADSAVTSVAAGSVRDAADQPVANAHVTFANGTNTTTSGDGTFALQGVPLGTRSLSVRAIGWEPSTAVVDVAPRDTARVAVVLRSITLLDTVRVSASVVAQRFLTALEGRRALGIAKFMDSTVIGRYGSALGAVTSQTSAARLTARGRLEFGGRNPPCRPGLWIDQRSVHRDDVMNELRLLSLGTVATIEVYVRATLIPPEFWPPTEIGGPCAIIVVWTKRMLP